jgi:regulatory protein
MSGREPELDGRARNVAMRLLARREHSRAELQVKLGRRGFGNALIRLLVKDLESHNFLSDERFAKSLISVRGETGYGPRRIGLELTNRGVAEAVIREAMARIDIDWHQCGADQATKKFGSHPPENFPEWARRARYLERRGFDSQVIRFAIGNFEETLS